MSTQDLINKLWNLCHLLRDDGVTYHEYLNELTYLVFLKMVEETGQEELIPEGYRWADIEKFDAGTLLLEYKKLLLHLGSNGSRITKAIFNNATTCIRKPITLTKLISEIDKLDWYSAKQEGLGDMYEGLLEINAKEKKSGAGQYFTPRVLIEVMVELMKPTPKDKRYKRDGDIIVDPTAGTGGFLISAHQYMEKQHDIKGLSESDYDSYQHETFFGMELVPDTRRLAMMNLMLHDLAVDDENSGVLYGDTLSNEGKDLPKASLILANPPFGTKQGGGIPTRDDLLYYTSNKQLAFLHAIYHSMLKPGGRAAVIVPDNALFEGSTGRKIRSDLMDKCNLHTILRLPTGIFYSAGVKTNVLFFDKPIYSNTDEGKTTKVWVYDLRTKMPNFGKRHIFDKKYFLEFYQAVGGDLTTVDESQRQAFINANVNQSAIGNLNACRLRAFTREDIKNNNDSLDLTWMKNDHFEDSSDLPDPDELISEAIEELKGAVSDLQAILAGLGNEDEEEVY